MDTDTGVVQPANFEMNLTNQIERICSSAGSPLYVEHINNFESLLKGYPHKVDKEIQAINNTKNTSPSILARRKFNFLMVKYVKLGFATKKTLRTEFAPDGINNARETTRRYIKQNLPSE